MSKSAEDVLEHIDDLRRYARRLTASRDAADDLVQDCIERALKNICRYRPTGSFKGWLITIMHNLFLDRFRRARFHREVLHQDPELFAKPVESHGGYDSVLLHELHLAISELPEHHREVMLLAAEGFSYKAMSEILGVPCGTVRSRLFRGRAELGDEFATRVRRAASAAQRKRRQKAARQQAEARRELANA